MPTPEEIKKQVLETSAIVENTLKSVAAQIGDIFQDALSEADGITKIFGKDVQKQLNSLARSTDKMVENQIKIKLGQASSKDIAKQLLEYEVKREVLEKRISNLMAEQPELAAQLKSQLADVDAANADYVEGLKEQEKDKYFSYGIHLSNITFRESLEKDRFYSAIYPQHYYQYINYEKKYLKYKIKYLKLSNKYK